MMRGFRLGLFVLGAVFAIAPAHAQTQPTLTIASSGGALEEAFKKAAKPFIDKNNIAVKWVPGTTSENAAKVAATKDNPEYDLVVLENLTQRLASRQGLLAEVDETIAANYKDLLPQGKPATKDGSAVGFFLTGLYYDPEEFSKRGLAAPQSWFDFSRPEVCNRIGLMHPNVSYGLHTIMMLAGGDPARIDEAIDNLAKLKNCITVLEPSAAKFDEKFTLREYMIGGHSTIRALPLIHRGVPMKFIIPKEGAILGFTTISVVKNSRNGPLAQRFFDWIVGPQAQKVLMEEAFYSPVNTRVAVPAALRQLGIPDQEAMRKAIALDENVVIDRRRDWIRQIERKMAR